MSSDRPLRHKKLYLPGGDVILRVDNYLCRVHSYFFTRESAYFRDLLLHQSSFGDQVKQSSDDNPIWLDDCTVDEFSSLCWIFYNPKYDVYTATFDEWATILRVSDLWGFAEITALVFRELEKLEVDPAMRIHLYQKHHIPSDLLHSAFEALTTRPEPLTEEEGRLLGINTFARVVHARELARSRDGGETPSPLTVSQDELRAILARLRLSPLHAHTNGGLNTDVPRANGPQSAPLLMHRSNSGDYSSKAGSMTVPATPLETIHESPSQSPSLIMGDLPPSYDRTTGGRSATGGPGKISIPPWNVKVYGKQRWA